MEKTPHFNLNSKENEYLYPNSYKIKKKKKIYSKKVYMEL